MFKELDKIFTTHRKHLQQVTLLDLFKDPTRFSSFSRMEGDILYDFSKQLISQELITDCVQYLEKINFSKQIDDLFSGSFVNITENRKVWHTELRAQKATLCVADTLKRMQDFTSRVHSGLYKSSSKSLPFKHVINVGIGGSELGVRMAYNALKSEGTHNQDPMSLYFLANTDSSTMHSILRTIGYAQTLCVISSKSFSTPETLLNFKILQDLFYQEVGADYKKHFLIITENALAPDLQEFTAEQIFPLWSWVGGRFSISSAIGLPLALSIGWDKFQALLDGMHAMDLHFQNTPFINNLPILMALIGMWNINGLRINNLAIIPYSDGLEHFPTYLQQLEMESNGKMVNLKGKKLAYHTAPIIWGGVGCNCQHSFFQALHQSTNQTVVDFILPVKKDNNEQQKFLIASCLAQSRALMLGRHFAGSLVLNNMKTCPGNKSSSTIIIKDFNSFHFGQLIALYEHKVFVQGILWDIASFDQWGVELGKTTTHSILQAMENLTVDLDNSSKGLLQYLL